jgi:hypothetical protein
MKGALSLPQVAHATTSDAARGAFMTLPAYSRSREGEGQELFRGVSNGSHTARSRPERAARERMEWVCEGTSAQGTARGASCMISLPGVNEEKQVGEVAGFSGPLV